MFTFQMDRLDVRFGETNAQVDAPSQDVRQRDELPGDGYEGKPVTRLARDPFHNPR